MNSLFRRKPIEDLMHNKSGSTHLKQTLGPLDLTLLGVGAIVGTGIFILPGTVAAKNAGPAIYFFLRDCSDCLCDCSNVLLRVCI